MAKQKNRTRLVKTLLEFSEKKTGQKRLKTKRIKSRYQLDGVGQSKHGQFNIRNQNHPCASCNKELASKYCRYCGERQLDPKQR